MKRLFLSVLLLGNLSMLAFSQTEQDRANFVDGFNVRVYKLDAYNMILPVLMTPEQIKKILPAIEKGRERVRLTRKSEYDELQKLDLRVNDALKNAADKGAVPPMQLMNEIIAEMAYIQNRRAVMAELNGEEVQKAMSAALTPPQLKAAANSLNPKAFNPKMKVEEMKQEDKLAIYAKEILMMPEAYDILVKMSMATGH